MRTNIIVMELMQILKLTWKSIEERINTLEETVIAENTKLGKFYKNYTNQIQILKEKSNNNQR